MTVARFVGVWGLAALLTIPLPGSAQQVEAAQRRFDEAKRVFAQQDQPRSIELFNEVIALLVAFEAVRSELQDDAPASGLDPADRQLLARSYRFRSEAQFNLGRDDDARNSLRRAIETAPELTLDGDSATIYLDLAEVSPKFLELFEEIRSALLVELVIDPVALFDEATKLFETEKQPQSIPLFDRAIQLLSEPPAGEGEPERQWLLAQSFLHRGEAQLNLGSSEEAHDSLRRAIETRPDVTLVRDTSPKLVQLLESMRSELVGTIELLLEPADNRLVLEVDGVALQRPFGDTLPLLEGVRTIVARRPGYEPGERVLSVRAGEHQALELVLERTAAIIVFAITTPSPGAEIWFDGEQIGMTEIEAVEVSTEESLETAARGTPPHPLGPDAPELEAPELEAPELEAPELEAPEREAPEPSEQTPPDGGTALPAAPTGPASFDRIVDDVAPGRHEVEVRREGHRLWRFELEIAALEDFVVERAGALEPSRGVITLSNIPQGARLEIDGEERILGPAAREAASFELPVGEHLLVADLGATGRFERTVEVADYDDREIPVVLTPAVTLLGVLGGDELSQAKLVLDFRRSLEGLSQWRFLNLTAAAAPDLPGLGLTAATLRPLDDETPSAARAIDWDGARATLLDRFPAAVSILAVLFEDLGAPRAELWIWGAEASLPPVRRSIDLATSEPLEAALAAFHRPLKLQQSRLGARIIDSDAVTGPVVASLSPGGPAARGGLQVGDRVLRLDGLPAGGAREIHRRLAESEPESVVALDLEGAAGPRSVEITLDSTPRVIPPLPERLQPVLWAQLAIALTRDDAAVPEWLARMNQAAILVHAGAWRAAVPLLRSVEAPERPGLGKAATDYWLGLALYSADAEAYGDEARAAFERAAAAPGGRLYDDDGPLIGPRAEARLRR